MHILEEELPQHCKTRYLHGGKCTTIKIFLNEFYTCFLFKTDALPQNVVFPLDIAVTFFNNLSPDVR